MSSNNSVHGGDMDGVMLGVGGLSTRSEPDGAPATNVSQSSSVSTSPHSTSTGGPKPKQTNSTRSRVSSGEVPRSISPNEPEDEVVTRGSGDGLQLIMDSQGPGPGGILGTTNPNIPSFCSTINSTESKIRPGEFVMRVLFAEFTAQAEKKIESVMIEPSERSLSKSLQRGEDAGFDQLLTAMGSVSEHCLPSVLRTLFAWYDRQGINWLGTPMTSASGSVSSGTGSSLTSSIESVEKEHISLDPLVLERRDMAVEFIFCLVLIEVLKQLAFHPGHNSLVGRVEDLAFAHFKYRESTGVHAANGLIIADLYAEVLGVLAQARFSSVRVRFLNELADLRGKEGTTAITQSIVSLLMGMKFFRIKMAPIEDFEASFQFLTECAKYFLEVKHRDIKHALAGLFVEILVPVAATVKHEVNVPCLKAFVEMLYPPTLDMCTRNKHRLAIFPLVTCLLCVSQRPFFLQNWHYFLAMCLSQLKSREPKMSRVALESLYRLLWAYLIRIKCESNSATQSRLLSVVNSLFPKGSKGVVPRDTPLNIFVKIIQFIAQERLDFAMREIIFELLSVGRPIKIILSPERMNIGLRAFLVAADSLQQKDGDPPMPRSAGIMPSGNTLLRVKKTFLNKALTDDAARSIGLAAYFPLIRKIFTDILRALDIQCGRPYLSISLKEQEDSLLTGDRKAKIDLFRTCVAAIPRIIPEGMSRQELLSLLARLTLHVDEELRGLAFQSLQSLLIDYPDWRNDVIVEFLSFCSKEVPDTASPQLDNALRMLLQLLISWRGVLTQSVASDDKGIRVTVAGASDSNGGRLTSSMSPPNSSIIYQAEAVALVSICSVRSTTRRIGAHMLKEIKGLREHLGIPDTAVLDILDGISPKAAEIVSSILPPGEKSAVMAALSTNSLDLQWLTERSASIWYVTEEAENTNTGTVTSSSLASSLSLLQSSLTQSIVVPNNLAHNEVTASNDPWAICLKEFFEYSNIPTRASRVTTETFSALTGKINSLYTYLEPLPLTDNRASLLRSAATPRKAPSDRTLYFKLWRNYLFVAFRCVPASIGPGLRCISPDVGISSSPEASDGRDGRSPLPLLSSTLTTAVPSSLYKLILPLMRSDTSDMRDLAVASLGQVNPGAIRDLFEDMAPYLREASDRKQENVRRRKRKDNLRLQLLRILELMATEGSLSRAGPSTSSLMSSYTVTPGHGHHHVGGTHGSYLPPSLIEFLDSCRGWLELETEREGGLEMRMSFCRGISSLLSSFEMEARETLLKKDTRRQLLALCMSWAGSYANGWGHELIFPPVTGTVTAELEFEALSAASSLLACGPSFQSNLLQEESSFYLWVNCLLSSNDPRISSLGEKVLIMILEFNPDVGSVLDWVVARCFTGPHLVGEACFRAIAVLFSAREYPCDRYVAIMNTALLYTGVSTLECQHAAFRLLQILDRRFFEGVSPYRLQHGGRKSSNDARNESFSNTLDSVLGKVPYAKSQLFLSKQLSILHPELTMPMFSEISWRMRSARPDVRQSLLRYLQPWLHNMELVEPAIPGPTIIAPLKVQLSEEQLASSSSSCSLCGKKYYDHREKVSRRGWGSTEATEMVLNNLMYLTAKFGKEHEREIKECWQTLCCLSPNNQRVVLYYLLIITGLAPSELLPFAKRVLIYLFRARPLKVLEDLMAELQTVESLNWLVERTETPPFYRLSHLRKISSYSDNPEPSHMGHGNPVNAAQVGYVIRLNNTSELEKGTIHTKRRSAEESTVFQQPHYRSSSSGQPNMFRTEKARTISGPAALPDTQFLASEKEWARAGILMDGGTCRSPRGKRKDECRFLGDQEQYLSSETIAAYSNVGGITQANPVQQPSCETLFETEIPNKLVPLPMPEYGGYYAPLKEFFPANPVAPFHRCNLALMFVEELVLEGTTFSMDENRVDRDGNRMDWGTAYIPLMIHMAFLGLDNLRPLVYQHSYSLLVNLLSVPGFHKSHLSVGKLILAQQTKELRLGLSLPNLGLPKYNFLDPETKLVTEDESAKHSLETTKGSPGICETPGQSPGTPSKLTHSPVNLMLVMPDGQDSSTPRRPFTIEDMTVALIQFLIERNGQPLWVCEDTTARVWNIKSAAQLSTFLQNSLPVLVNSFPNSNLERKWARVALQIGLACSSRHYAGRSLQVYRALRVPLQSRTLCDILSRLVETVAEPGDDMQGYVTELILTLEASVEAIHSKECELESQIWADRDEELDEDEGTDLSDCDEQSGTRDPPILSSPQMRARSGTETCRKRSKRPVELCRSRSVQSLSYLAQEFGENMDPLDRVEMPCSRSEVIPQVFWLGVSLLESDYEHEYHLALGLLEKVTERLPLDRTECQDKVERVQVQLQWNAFGGIIPLILKGCTNPNTYEQSLHLLCRFIPALHLGFVDPTGETGFPLTVMAFMPYLLTYYDDPLPLCLQAARLIAEVGSYKGENGCQPLQHLATVMTLYSRRSFTKESFQWNKCVVKYLYDSYAHIAPLLLSFLLDVLEKGPVFIHSAILSLLHCSFNYVDLSTVGAVSPELLRAVQKHLDGPLWKDSLRILKLVVTRSSSLVAPPPPFSSQSGNSGPSSMASDSVSSGSTAFSSDVEFNYKKELPGRTMEFSFDVSQTPIVGRRQLNSGSGKDEFGGSKTTGVGLSQRSSSIGEMGLMGTSSTGLFQAAWKRPWQCQSRVRECLVSVLNACGQRVGLPKSPSVIFSQSSELLERQSSVASSTEEVSVAINDGSGGSRLEEGSASEAQFRVFRDFDFLEYELESVDGEANDNFNWGVRRRPLSELGTEPETEGEADDIQHSTGTPSHVSQLSSDLITVRGQSGSIRSEIMELGGDREDYSRTGEWSDDEELGLSPVDERASHLEQEAERGSSLLSSPARSRRLSDTSLDSRSGDETPSNISPHVVDHLEEPIPEGYPESEDGSVVGISDVNVVMKNTEGGETSRLFEEQLEETL